ncbi:ATP-binding protein [Streptomyces sp. HNM0575]|uniref:ATP-binding protein n=1 Tax=Streptomyces sp. HNM0575 TaxID=2716338 RepID=UPI00145F5556|nr:ATP-binding protein [Streptomyces sp. HNM0575]NLU73581.1 ATP-binding protein [Streptomyces sp. HNM0575]
MTARTTGKSRTHCAVEFQALPSRIGQVRRIVTAQLRYWRLEPLIDAAALGVTELLTNVHRHTGSDKHCTVEIVFRRDHLTVSVRDHDPRLPRVRAAEPSATNGRGLALIAAVSASWGMRAQNDGSGKVVWFTLPVTLGTPPPRTAGAPPALLDEAGVPALAGAAGTGPGAGARPGGAVNPVADGMSAPGAPPTGGGPVGPSTPGYP